MPKSEDKCLAWLGDLEIPPEEKTTIERLQGYLERQFPNYNESQISALLDVADISRTLEEHGIVGLGTLRWWGYEQRYAIQGMPGLWGYEAVQTIREAEEW